MEPESLPERGRRRKGLCEGGLGDEAKAPVRNGEPIAASSLAKDRIGEDIYTALGMDAISERRWWYRRARYYCAGCIHGDPDAKEYIIRHRGVL